MNEAGKLRKACQQENCAALGYACFSVFEPTDPLGFWCEKHMHQNGFCPGCHLFLAGTEDFDFGPDDFCSTCRLNFSDDEINDEEEDEEYEPEI